MTELNQKTDCIRVGHSEEKGQVVLSEMIIERAGRHYSISVAKPDYLERLRLKEKDVATDVQIEENCLPYEGIQTEDEICQHLAKVPLSELSPYLTEIREVPGLLHPDSANF